MGNKFCGCITALVTPFDKNNKINYQQLAKMLDFQIKSGVSGVVIAGTTGEGSLLSCTEKSELLSFAIKYINKRILCIAGVAACKTIDAIEQVKNATNIGADACLVVSPYYVKGTQNGIYKHYKQIAELGGGKIIIYNVPGRTGVNVEPKTIIKLSKIDNIVGLKQASSNISDLLEIKKGVGENFGIFSGEDGLVFPMLACGAVGAISVASNIVPRKVQRLCDLYFCGEIAASRKLQLSLLSLVKKLFEKVNPVPVKNLLNKQKMFFVGKPRLPLC